jgi:hypothetical protein
VLPRLSSVPPVRYLLPALAAALALIAGCASAAPTVATGQPPATPPSASSLPDPAGYACSSADIFSQPVGVQVRQQVSLGDTTAVLTGTSASDGVEPSELRDGVLTITRTGHPTVTLPVTAPAGTPIVDLFILYTQAQESGTDDETAGSLCLGRFSDGAAPVALLALTTGGAHCCFTVRAVPSAGGAAVDHEFGNYSPWFRQTANGPLLVSADNAFAYQFGSFAGSGPPIQLFNWNGTALTDVTREHLDLVADDAQNFLALFNDPSQPEKLGSLAGWVADECLLGKSSTAWAFVDEQQQLGLPEAADYAGAGGYPAALRTFLAAHGYCSDSRVNP